MNGEIKERWVLVAALIVTLILIGVTGCERRPVETITIKTTDGEIRLSCPVSKEYTPVYDAEEHCFINRREP